MIVVVPEPNKDGQPRRHGLPAKGNYDVSGYSDHFPISMVISSTIIIGQIIQELMAMGMVSETLHIMTQAYTSSMSIH